MALPYTLTDLSGVDEQFRALYKEQEDGTFKLELTDFDDAKELKSALEKERSVSAQEKQRRKELEDAQALREHKAHEEKKRLLIEKGDLQGALELERKEKSDLMAKMEERDRILTEKDIDSMISKVASELASKDAIRQRDLKDIYKRFVKKTDEGYVYEAEGRVMDSAQFKEFISNRSPNLVDGLGANGGGALGSNGGRAATGKNPFKKGEHYNLTEQAKILREDPALATRFKQEALTNG